MKYWQRWIGAWKSKTAHLSFEERGAYGECLDWLYAHDTHILPGSKDAIYRIAGCQRASERKAVDTVLAEFFVLNGAGYHHPRVQEELGKRLSYVEQQRQLSLRRWAKERAEQEGRAAPEDDSPIVATLPCKDGSQWIIRESFVKRIEPLYPMCDIPATLAIMQGWLMDAARRKPRRGMTRFITGWLARDQERYANEKAGAGA